MIPYVFQEANYDDISWSDQKADLGHLQSMLEVDFLVQNGGRNRLGVTDQVFHSYVELSFRAIHKLQQPAG